MLYSATTGWFYDPTTKASRMPSDVVEITPEQHAALLAGQAAGKQIMPGNAGLPVLRDPVVSVEARIAALRSAVAMHLDAAAQAKGYDNIINAALRSAYAGPYKAEGTAFAQWMDACWEKCYELLAKRDAGTLTEPTPAQLVAMLPSLVLP